MNELGEGEGVNLAAAAITLGLNRNSSVIEELGASLGFDTVSLGGDGGLESTSLLLGKHLSPNLYVSYAKDIFSDISAYQLNYQLTDNLSLEAESGRTQEVDLIYSIKR
jgi:translocation and assembly module TamB